jgi:hypothetical protein
LKFFREKLERGGEVSLLADEEEIGHLGDMEPVPPVGIHDRLDSSM